ncbi:hypothetical protein L6164_013107 [Bauhinia variegata]|uniref:Uncharacterized protein n=1 Tax=Bauhinia variegata TaxID=167791 RepID=A0ACB9PDK8_BAUVA|nr:hypothetical protein L6164_013107 [Bauhinia variegata]
MQQLKLGYLKSFVERTELNLEHCFSKLQEWENNIRLCYGKIIEQKIEERSDEFVKMILIDACFIIEHFIRYYYLNDEGWEERDPLFLKPWITEEVTHDLILLENQLPFFVLKRIFKLATAQADYPSFLELTFNYFKFFNAQNLRPDGVIVQHFTDLLRTFHLPPRGRLPERSEPGVILDHLYSTSELVEAGLEFKVSKNNKCLLDLQYHQGVLTMPCLDISDMTEILMRNIAAFEQRHYPSMTYITDYLKFLDFLINVEKDVDKLVSEGIITTLLGDSKEVAKMVNRLCKNLTQVNFSSYYLDLSGKLNAYYENPVHKYKANLIHQYFSTPWKIATSSAAILLLLLTLIQTICSILSLL